MSYFARRGLVEEKKRPAPVVPAELREPVVRTVGGDRRAEDRRRNAGLNGPGSDEMSPLGELPVDPATLPPLLFEVGWEVCWQLGGIYTVLKTKAVAMINTWGERYTLIGPYNPATAALEFEEMAPQGEIAEALERLRKQGVGCHYGRWLVPGRPKVILLDHRGQWGRLGEYKYALWRDHGITAPDGDNEVSETILFGFAVTQLFRELGEVLKGRPIIGHFHEWMGGVAVPRIAHERLPVRTVFTTHATLLGRYLASDNPYFYEHLPFIDPDREAAKYNIYTRYAIEKAAAHASTVFTTVSEVTSIEAERLLGRTPDAILPNGLNIQRFAALHEFQNLHQSYKERIHEFVMGHFFPSYTFNLDNTLYLVTAGRYEYRNKGIDMFIESLARLNHRLKQVPDRPTIVAFIITRAPTKNINVGTLQNQSMFEELRNVCVTVERQMGDKLFQSCATGRLPQYNELLGDDALVRLKRAMHATRTSRQPTIVTHDLQDDASDPILRQLRAKGLFNAADDPVKVVFHPDFVSATSPLIPLDYEQFLRGCHMGVFPSYYEPWGYTPMECAALGVPAVTTDLSGFGAYVRRHVPEAANSGMFIVNRRHKGFDQTTDELTDLLFNFARMSRRQRIDQRNRVERISELFDWNSLGRHYNEAHELAMQRVPASGVGQVQVKTV